jgi:hypothetical protein
MDNKKEEKEYPENNRNFLNEKFKSINSPTYIYLFNDFKPINFSVIKYSDPIRE